MNGLKKWMAIIMTGVTIIGNMAGPGVTVMGEANAIVEELKLTHHGHIAVSIVSRF